jgi:hypothetical protein
MQFVALSLSRKTICYYNYIAKKPNFFFAFLFFARLDYSVGGLQLASILVDISKKNRCTTRETLSADIFLKCEKYVKHCCQF